MRQLASVAAAALIADLEGFSENAYQDRAGVWTIGFGTTIIGARRVQEGDTITRERAMQVLQAQCLGFARQVDLLVPQSVGQVAFDALTSFAYNVGIAAFERSTMLKLIVDGDIQGAADQFPRWVFAGGERSDGLRKRRAIERGLFIYDTAMPRREASIDETLGVGY